MDLSKLTDVFSKIKGLSFGKQGAESKGPSVILACDLGQSKITLLEVQLTDTLPYIRKFKKIPRPTQNVAAGIKECVDEMGLETNNVRISLKGHGVIVRFIQFPKMSYDELKGAMLYEAEKYIPFKADEVILDFHILDEEVEGADEPMMNILMVAVKKDEVYSLIQTYQDAGLMVELVDIDALAHLNALEFANKNTLESTVAVLDLGKEVSTLCVSQKGKPRFIRDISFGYMDILKRMKRKLGLSDEDAVKKFEDSESYDESIREVINESVAQLSTDLKVSLDYYLDQVTPSDPVTTLFVGGGDGADQVIRANLNEELGFGVEAIDFIEQVQIDGSIEEEVKKNSGALLVALGLALRNA